MIVGRILRERGWNSYYKDSGESMIFLEQSSQEYGELVGIIGISRSYGMAYGFSLYIVKLFVRGMVKISN